MSRQIGFAAGADRIILRTLHLLTHNFGLSFGFYQNCVESCWWNGDESVEVCFNNEQTTGFSKTPLQQPSTKITAKPNKSRAERLYCAFLFKQTVGIIV